MGLECIYNEQYSNYTIEENGFLYVMPYAFYLKARRFKKESRGEHLFPVQAWFNSLREIEKKIVRRVKKQES